MRFTRPAYDLNGVHWHQADLRDVEAVNRLLAGMDVVIQARTGVMAITTWMLAHMDAQTPTIYVAALISTRGLSLGFCMMPNQTAAYNTVPHGGLARATALANGFQRFLSSGASAFLGTILNLRTLAHAAALGATGLVVVCTPSRLNFGSATARMAATTTGKYSGRQPAITALTTIMVATPSVTLIILARAM